jgi:ribosomal protein S18 acetylase RimI-like enzyme
MDIRAAEIGDEDGLWRVLEPVIRAGETYPLPRDMARADALAYWLAPDHHIFVAEENGEILGTYYLRANSRAGGGHVANAGYMTAPHARGRGVATALCLHSFEEAKRLGFRAMQFNLVIASNEAAMHLWPKLGMDIVGRLPGAFHHPRLGYVDAYVMYKTL